MLDEQARRAVKDVTLQLLEEETRLFFGSDIASRSGRTGAPAAMVANLARAYGALLKSAIDAEDRSGVDAIMDSYDQAFAFEMWRDLAFRYLLGQDRESLYGLSLAYANAALFGVDGWVIYLIDKNDVDREFAAQVRERLRHSESNPWAAFRVVREHESHMFFGWTFWESLRKENRRGGILELDTYVRQAILISAASRHAVPSEKDLVQPDSRQSETLSALQVTARQLVEILDRLVAQQTNVLARSVPVDLDGAGQLTQQLRHIAADAAYRLVDLVIDRPLSNERIFTFHNVVAKEWATSWRALGLFPSVEYEGPSDTNITGWMYFGPYVTTSKDYFFESDVHADTKLLASQYVKSQLQAEALYLKSQLSNTISHESVALSDFPQMLRQVVKRFSESNRSVQVILFTSWRVIDRLRQDGIQISESFEIGEVGNVEGAPIFWERDVGNDQCHVFVPHAIGRVWWRQTQLEDGDASVAASKGRLVVGVRAIDEQLASNLLTKNPGLILDGESETERARRLRQMVLTKVREVLRWETLNREAGLVIDVVKS